MRNTYRYKNNFQYWTDRWENLDVDKIMNNTSAYPLKYSEKLIKNDKSGLILEAGCGNGRLIRFYHEKGFKIIGIDFIGSSIKKLKNKDDSLNVLEMSVHKMDFPSNHFKYITAFGLFHNLEKNLIDALIETHRVLSVGGMLCASFRADNLQNKIIDFLYEKRFKGDRKKKFFHKSNFRKKDLHKLFKKSNFEIVEINNSENMSFLYKFRFFRTKKQNIFNENIGRRIGYRLNWLGRIIHSFLLFISSDQFCNVYVVFAKK